MASGSGPSPSGLIILTGMTIAAVVGLYAYDAIPRRGGVVPSANFSWPRWQAENPAAQTQIPQPPAYTSQKGSNRTPQYPQDPRGQDVPEDQQNAQGGAGRPPLPDGRQGE